MKSKQKRGFTLVELVIVIAVIAILSAVLVPSFIAIIDKAKSTSDVQLAKSIEKDLLSYNTELDVAPSAPDIRFIASKIKNNKTKKQELVPTNKENKSFWYDIENQKIILSTGEDLESSSNNTVKAQVDNYVAMPEEIIPGYYLLDTGGSILADAIYGIRDYGNDPSESESGTKKSYDECVKSLKDYLNKSEEKIRNDLHITPSQLDYAIKHIEKFKLDNTIYVGKTGYKMANERIFDNIIFADNISVLPSLSTDLIKDDLVVAIRNGCVVPLSVKGFDPENILYFIGLVDGVETYIKIQSNDATVSSDPKDPTSKLFSDYAMSACEKITYLNTKKRPGGNIIYDCSFEFAVDKAVLKNSSGEQITESQATGDSYSEISLKINIPLMYTVKELDEDIYYKGIGDTTDKNKIKFTKNGEEMMIDTSTKDYEVHLLNDDMKEQLYSYTNLGDGRVRVNVIIRDEYGLLCRGTKIYSTDIKIEKFIFNEATILFSTPSVVLNDNQRLEYKLFINGVERQTLSGKEQYIDKDLANYILDNTTDLEGYLIFLSQNENYIIYDGDYYCTYDKVTASYVWHNEKGDTAKYVNGEYKWSNSAETKQVVLPTKNNIGNFYLMKTLESSPKDENKTSYITESSKLTLTTILKDKTTQNIIKEGSSYNEENVIRESVIEEYYYRTDMIVKQTYLDEQKQEVESISKALYINNEVEETHSSYTRYIYPSIINTEYLKLVEGENGEMYNTMDARIELYFIDDSTNTNMLLASNNEIFGTEQSPIKTYYYTETVTDTQSITYGYYYDFRNPLYYSTNNNEEKTFELLSFVDKDVVEYEKLSSNSYRFTISKGEGENLQETINSYSGVLNSKGEPVYTRGAGVNIYTILDSALKTVEMYDATYQVTYTYDKYTGYISIEIVGVDTGYSIYGSEDYNTYTYTQRKVYRFGISAKDIENTIDKEYVVTLFNGKQVEKIENTELDYEITLYKNEEFNPLTTKFLVDGLECNGAIFPYEKTEYTDEEVVSTGYSGKYEFRINDSLILTVYYKEININVNFTFLYNDIEESEYNVILSSGETKTIKPQSSDEINQSIECSYGELITLEAKETSEDSLYSFIAWYYIDKDGKKALLSTNKVVTYKVISDNSIIICEYANKAIRNELFVFTYTTSNTCTLTYCNEKSLEKVYIPSYSGDSKVVKIDASAFKGVTGLKEIHIPDSIENIDSSAFLGSKITQETTKPIYIGNILYRYNDVINETTNEPVTEYRVKEGTKIISESAFRANNNLKVVYLPSSVTTINDNAFQRMLNLEYVYLADDSLLAELKTYVFTGCMNFKGIMFERNKGTEDFSLPETLTKIGSCCFQYCKSLEKFDFTNISSIGSNCFQYCVNLDNVDLTNKTLTTIPSSCFNNCAKLSNIVIGSNITTISTSAFSYCSALVRFVIPNTVTKLNNNLFQECTSLQEVSLPKTITEIPAYIFQNCIALEKIIYTNDDNEENTTENLLDFTKLTKIDKYAFNGCYSYPFGNLVIGSSTNKTKFTIGEGAFYECRLINSVVFKGAWATSDLPASVFYNCSGLQTADLNKATNLGANFFSGCINLGVIKNASTKTINNNVFYNCQKLTSKIFDFKDVASIGDGAFYQCYALGLGNVVLENKDKIVIGNNAFNGCYKLYSITIKSKNVEFKTTTSLNNFNYCNELKSIIIDADILMFSCINYNVSQVTTQQFIYSDAKLEKVEFNCYDIVFAKYNTSGSNLGNNLFTDKSQSCLPNNIFRDCTSLKYVVLPYKLTKLGKLSFVNCKNLLSITKFYSSEWENDETKVNELNKDYHINEILKDSTLTFYDYVKGANQKVSTTGFVSTDKYSNSELTKGAYIDLTTGIILNNKKDTIIGYLGTNRELTLPETSTITGINKYAFASIKEVDKVLNDDSFINTPIKKLILGTNIVTIGDYAFQNSTIREYDFNQTAVPEISENAFDGVREDTIIFVPDDLESGYNGNKAFSNITLNNQSKLKIEGNTLTKYDGWQETLILPENVTTIGKEAFLNNKTIREIGLTNVRIIEEGAFSGCTNLSVVIGEKVESIKSKAFYGCTNLTNMELPTTLSTIGDEAFKNSGLTQITIPEKVTKIGKEAFNTASLEVVVSKPSTAPTIDGEVFGSNLKMISVINSMVNHYKDSWSIYSSKIQASGSGDVSEAYTPNIENGVLVSITGYSSVINLSTYTITSIKENAFNGMGLVKEIILPKTITTIGASAFSGCKSLTTLNFITVEGQTEKDVTIINESAFENCSELTTIGGLDFSKVKTIGNKAFAGCKKLNMTITLNLNGVGSEVFSNCENLKEITINSLGINYLPTSMFYGCSQLSKVTLPSGYVKISDNAFYNCSKLKTIVNLDYSKLTTIGKSAFYNCSLLSINDLTISVIGESSFESCKSIINVNLSSSTLTTLPLNAFKDCTALKTVKLSSKMTTIGNNAFAGCTNLAKVSDNDEEQNNTILLTNVKQINTESFLKCSSINTLIINSANTCTIKSSAFENCTNLQKVNIETTASLEKNVFKNCAKLYSYIAPKVTNYGEDVFNNCQQLKEFDFGSLTAIPNNIFNGAKSLVKVIAKNVTTIGNNAFFNCENLQYIYIDFKNVKQINTGAFKNCNKLDLFDYTLNEDNSLVKTGNDLIIGGGEEATNLMLGSSVFMNTALTGKVIFNCNVLNNSKTTGYLDANTFYGAQKLEEVQFKQQITIINSSAFYNCISLKRVTSTEDGEFNISNVQIINSSVFYNCRELNLGEELTLNAKTIGSYAFSYMTKLNKVILTNTDLNLSSSKNTINSNTFDFCINLKEVILPQGRIWLIKSYAFRNCYNLQTIENLDMTLVQELGYMAFSNCKKLDWGETLTIGSDDKVITFSTSVFLNNYLLKNVVIKNIYQSGTKYIERLPDSTFNGCFQLQKVSLPSSIIEIGTSTFSNCINLSNLTTTEKGDVGEQIFDFSKLICLGNNSFNNCISMTYDNGELVFDNLSKGIGTYAFSNNLGIKKVTFLGTIKDNKISQYAFNNCANMTCLKINSTIKIIDISAFNNCYSLEKIIDIDENGNELDYGLSYVTTINQTAFSSCDKLSSDIKLSSLTTLGTQVFSYCKSLMNVDFTGSKITTIPLSTFSNCENLETVIMTKSITTIDKTAFNNCYRLANIDISNVSKAINDNAFTNCRALKEVVINKSIKCISKATFSGCVGLIKVTFGEKSINSIYTSGQKQISDLSEIKDSAFDSCISLIEIIIPENVVTIGQKAFNGCKLLVSVKFENEVSNKKYSINKDAFINSTLVRILFVNDKNNSIYNNYLKSFSSVKVVKSSDLDMNAYKYGFVIDGDSLIMYNGEYRDIKIEKDSISFRKDSNSNYEKITLKTQLENITRYSFSMLGDISITIDTDNIKNIHPRYNYMTNIIND